MITIVGLGNPEESYTQTRHNVGRIMAESIREHFNLPDWKEDKKRNALVSKGNTAEGAVELLLPQTFMNKSGASLGYLKGSAKKIDNTLVIHDDLDMPIGTAKMLFNRGDGGHRGVMSVNRAVGSKAYVRIKVGISKTTPGGKIKKPKGDEAVGKHVLGKFSPDEMKVIKKIEKAVIEAIKILMEEGRGKAQTVFNSRY